MGEGQKHRDPEWNRMHNLRGITWDIMGNYAGYVAYHRTECSEVMTHSLLRTKYQQLKTEDCNLERTSVRNVYNEMTFERN
jgi:hypothetical protein